MPPQVNATLTKVTTATAATGGRDDWDAANAGLTGPALEPAGSGTLKWQGRAGAYFQQTIRQTTDGLVGADVLYLDSAVVREAGLDTDDVIAFTDSAGVQHVGTATIVALRELAGVPRELQTTRIELELRT